MFDRSCFKAAAAACKRRPNNAFPPSRVLQLYMHLVSRLGQPAMQRNPLLMNKSSDLWTNTDAPADWWGAVTPAPKYRNCKLQPAGPAGRWTAPKAVSADDD
jgi:hypothetical protein